MRYITVNLEVIIYCNKSFSYERLIVSTARHMERYYYIWTRSRISDFLHLDAFNLSQHATQVQTLTGNSLIYIEIEINLFCLQTVIYDSIYVSDEQTKGKICHHITVVNVSHS